MIVSALFSEGPGDPLLKGDINGAVVGIIGIKVLIVFALLLVATMFMVWFERKVIADLQNRIGPNRTGPFGILQTLADGLKLFGKEDLMPAGANKLAFRLAPILVVTPAFLTFAILPFGGDITLFGHTTRLQLADPEMGVLWLLVMASVSIFGVILAGWSSNSKYALLGSVRAAAQMISYEAAMAIALVSVILISGSLQMSEIVSVQMERMGSSLPDWLHSWNIVSLAFVPAAIFIVAAAAEMNRPPFDFVEAEQELVSGFNTEYSSMRFAMFYLAEFMNVVTMSGIIATLFLGGGDGPTFGLNENLMYAVWLLVKMFVLMYCFVWVRGTLPRLRYDQLMSLGWKQLIPISLFWLLLVAASQVSLYSAIPVLVGGLVFAALLVLANDVGIDRSLDDEESVVVSSAASSSRGKEVR